MNFGMTRTVSVETSMLMKFEVTAYETLAKICRGLPSRAALLLSPVMFMAAASF
ncbi:hypothetical protein D1872_331180 [compost metagenome]